MYNENVQLSANRYALLHTFSQGVKMPHRIGLLVNPIAGMGGSVGLKGTDGGLYQRALELGADPVTPARTRAALTHLNLDAEVHWLAAPGEMGADYAEVLASSYEVVGKAAEPTTDADTRRIAQRMVDAGAELLVFVGGDGTARDIYDAIDGRVPVVGVPAGVKVFSSVFAVNPEAAAEMVAAFLRGADVTEQEVLDIDEDAYRDDRLDAHLYGVLRVPDAERLSQRGKRPSARSASVAEQKQEIAAGMVDEMVPGTLYLLGPGTTVRAVADALGVEKTLLGVDAVVDGERVGVDLNERALLALLDDYPERRIIVTPIGGNGFVFGRGNKQLTPAVLRRVGSEHVIIVATPEKLADVDVLRVDTGDAELDALLSGYREVVVGYRRARMIKVVT